jgi:hypothetical protein
MARMKPTAAQRLVQFGAALSLAGLAALANVARSQTNDAPQMLFLHLQFREGAPVLRDWTVRPGTVKARPAPDGPVLAVEVQDEKGRALWQTAIPDPRVRRIESHDPAQRNGAGARCVVIENPELTLRIPLLREARQVELFAPNETDGSEGAQRRSVGRLKLPLP